MRTIDPKTLRTWITNGGELAILDAREEGEFGQGHLFWAVPCPLSRRETRARALLPRLETRIVCVDAGGGEAARLAEYLAGIGATDVAVLDGGTRAWATAGFELFSGINVPSKAFGEWVEHHYGTESIDAPNLAEWIKEGRKLVLLDSRPIDEFTRMSIPGAINVPGGELAYRIGDLAPDPGATIVINCAGRTRSILGAESLRRVGVPNRVLALRNGTMGWKLAGLATARGRTERYPPGTPRTAALARDRASAFAETCGVGVIGSLDLARFEEDPNRTCYVLDVRDPEEFRAGHRPGSVNAPGGQLVQATDRWVAVRGARIALIDDDGVRARMTGAWLRQMGHRDVFVVEGALDDARVAGPATVTVPELRAPVETITAPALAEALTTPGTVVINVGRGLDHRAGHIPGAIWGIRSRLDRLAPRLAGAVRVVVTSRDGAQARLAVSEVRAIVPHGVPVLVLKGGTAAWRAAGYTVAVDRRTPSDADCIDTYLRPYDRNDGVEAAMREYLSWEIALLEQIARDGTVRFGVEPEE